MEKVFVRSNYNYDRDKASEESGLLCEDESLTVQSEAVDADINTIVKRFGLTGTMPERLSFPSMEDFAADVFDFQSAMNLVVQGEREFMRMPAEVRSRFGNSPQAFLEFVSATDHEGKLVNLEELRRMGLAKPLAIPDPPPEPMLVRVVKEDGGE